MATTLLIIDGEVAFLERLADSCRDRGYAVSSATTAQEGVDVAIATQPAVILLDAMIPGEDAWLALEELTAHARTRAIPVILSGGVAARPPGYRATPAAWLQKPFTPADLFATMDRVLGLGPAAAQPK